MRLLPLLVRYHNSTVRYGWNAHAKPKETPPRNPQSDLPTARREQARLATQRAPHRVTFQKRFAKRDSAELNSFSPEMNNNDSRPYEYQYCAKKGSYEYERPSALSVTIPDRDRARAWARFFRITSPRLPSKTGEGKLRTKDLVKTLPQVSHFWGPFCPSFCLAGPQNHHFWP